MKTIETKRLRLRGLSIDDLEAFYAYSKNPNVGPNAGWQPHQSLEESKGLLEGFIAADNILAITLRDGGRMIGTVGIHADPVRSEMSDCKMIGYVLDEAYWGKGYMTEAVVSVLQYLFEDLKCRIVSVHHFTFNDRSKRVIEKCGFIYEGTIRQNFKRYDGAYFDSRVYSMTRREYFIRKARQAGLTLMLPEKATKEAYMDYYAEWQRGGEAFTPFACGLQSMSYREWLRQNILSRTVTPDGFVPATSFFLVDDTGYIYGMLDIRHKLNAQLKNNGGHIGYGIRPSVRNKGCAQLLLALALEKCAAMGIKRVLVTCDEANEGSYQTIEANGGVLENTVEDGQARINRYWLVTDERN